jgi:hypothetical protein
VVEKAGATPVIFILAILDFRRGRFALSDRPAAASEKYRQHLPGRAEATFRNSSHPDTPRRQTAAAADVQGGGGFVLGRCARLRILTV